MIILVFSLMMFVTVSGTTHGSEMDCISVIKVPRNTVAVAPVMTELKINCTVVRHGCHRNPRISWYKFYGNDFKALNYSDHMRTEWKNMTEREGMAFLIFQNISMEDAGSYRCKEGDTAIGHTINVTVTADNKNNEFSPTIVGLVFIVMTVTFLYTIRCQGRKCTRKHMANKNQYMDTQKKDPLLPPHLCLDSDLLTYVVYRVQETMPQ